jgi:hypothetical protein
VAGQDQMSQLVKAKHLCRHFKREKEIQDKYSQK